jgi:hypothetical protein
LSGRDVPQKGGPLTANGTSQGVISVSDTLGYYPAARAWLSGTGLLSKEVYIVQILTGNTMTVRYVDEIPTTDLHQIYYGTSDVSVYTVAAGASINMPSQLVNTVAIPVDIAAQSQVVIADVTPVNPIPGDYLPVRLTDGSAFYTASGGGGGSVPAATFGAPLPAEGIAAAYDDGINSQAARVYDTDTAVGTEWTLGVNLRKSSMGGSVEFGTLTDPVRVDPTGTTTQPVSGTVSANIPSKQTFITNATSVATSASKSMLSLLNGSGSDVIEIREVYIANQSYTTKLNGVVGVFEFKRFTGHSAGTTLSVESFDTTNTIDPLIVTKTGATIAGESSSFLLRKTLSTDEWGPVSNPGDSTDETVGHYILSAIPIYKTELPMQGIVLRGGQGLNIKFNSITTTGVFDITVVFVKI